MPPKSHVKKGAPTTTSPSFIVNSLPDGLLLHLSHCHPQLSGAAVGIMVPGTAFEVRIVELRVARGVFLSPTEWYVDQQSRPMMLSLGNARSELHLDFKKYPGSHIPDTRTPALFATMVITRIYDDKAFLSMVMKMDPRILQEIQRRCPSQTLETAPSPILQQFLEVICPPFGCDDCHRKFSCAKGLAKHKCEADVPIVPPPCQVCQKQYSTQRWLNAHMAQFHRPPSSVQAPSQFSQFEVVSSPFGCDACHRSFSSAKGLAKHKCEAGDETKVPPPCTICRKQYNSHYWLNRHIEQFHGGLISGKIPHFTNHQQASLTARPQDDSNGPSTFRFEQFGQHPEGGAVDDDEDIFSGGSSRSAHDDINPFTFVESIARPHMLHDVSTDEEKQERGVCHTVMLSGLTSMELLSLANGWERGQEFTMEYKMRPGNSGDVANLGSDWKDYDTIFTSHGMLCRWDFTGTAPGPIVSYLKDRKARKKTKYVEEYLDCTEDCVVLSVNQVPQSAKFDSKRRKIMREEDDGDED